jgi:hypothetical protein
VLAQDASTSVMANAVGRRIFMARLSQSHGWDKAMMRA